MAETEFIIALTEHRFLGKIFLPFLIDKREQYYTISKHLKARDLKEAGAYPFKPYERQLIEVIDRYSDERLMKRFSREKSASAFYASLDKTYYEKQVVPHIEKYMHQVALILMVSPVRLFVKDAKYANLYEEDQIEVLPLFAHPVFYFERKEEETRYSLKIKLGDTEIMLQQPNIRVVTNDPCMLIYRQKLVVFEKLTAKKLIPFFDKTFVSAPHSVEEKYYRSFVLNVIRDFEVHATGFRIEESVPSKSAELSFEKDLKFVPCFHLSFLYGQEKFFPGAARSNVVTINQEDGQYVFRKIFRDQNWEKEILLFLNEKGLVENNGYFYLKGSDLLASDNLLYYLVEWLSQNKDVIQEKNIRITQHQMGKTYHIGDHQFDLKVQQKNDWFDVYTEIRFGEYRIPFVRLRKYLLNGIRELELPNGEIAVLPEEWFTRIKELLPFARMHGNQMEIDKHHYTLLKGRMLQSDSSLLEKIVEMESPDRENPVLPAGLKAELRSYQKDGFRWMLHLYKNGFGGCLADDMGLGKTLQTLAILLKLKRKQPVSGNRKQMAASSQLSLFPEENSPEQIQPSSLIVVPTSLVHNWDNEITKFAPSLSVYRHTGAQRKKAEELAGLVDQYDVVITTYGVLRNDLEAFAETLFFYLILDESQYIKNPDSKIYKAVMRLRAQHRLVLTGTPIENSLSDLWAQMNFLNKGLLGNLAFFRRYFITPVEKHGNTESQEKLRMMISPFVLRRKKEEVARDLPPLMEEVIICEMTGAQQKQYEAEKSKVRNAILVSIEKDGIKRSSFVILQGLTKLRQLANHPSLIDNDALEDSGKTGEIFRMLENLMAEKHKVLIFSSFVKHLELLRIRIEQENWKYAMLTGKTNQREEVIKTFRNDPENRIFLISLKAGGVGLNLTKADYVFILDPWWNPAAEMQALSRAHRIGQEKHVFVYRFITENSIEEKIQKLKERKSSLADKFINSNNPFTEITREEIMDLLE